MGETKIAMEIISSIIILVLIFWIGTTIIKLSSRGKRLMTTPSTITAINGVFTLILYGGSHSNDLETVVILAKENDRYTLNHLRLNLDLRLKRAFLRKKRLLRQKCLSAAIALSGSPELAVLLMTRVIF